MRLAFARRAFRLVAVPVVLRLAAALAVAALAAPAQAQVTGLWYQWSGNSAAPVLLQPPGTFNFSGTASGLFLDAGVATVIMNPGSGHAFQPGAYEQAARAPFSGSYPGLDMTVGSGGCNAITGRFSVLEVELGSGGQLTRFAADYQLGCDGVAPYYGELRFNSTVPFTVDKTAQSTTPDPFAFLPAGPFPASTQAISNSVGVYGINAPAAISITGGEYSVNGAAYISSPGTVLNRDAVRVRTTAGAAPGTVSAVLTIGGVQASFEVVTVDPGAALSGFHFVDYTSGVSGAGQVTEGFAPGWTVSAAAYPSQVNVAVSSASSGYGMTFLAPSGAPIAPGAYENAARAAFAGASPGLEVTGNGFGCNTISGRFVILELTVANGTLQSFAADFEQYCDATGPEFGEVRVNSSVPFTEFKPAGSTMPDPFAFTAVKAAQAGQQYVSNTISVIGTNAPVPVSIVGGEYSVNGGAFTSAPGSVTNLDHLRVRATAAAAPGAMAAATLNLGGQAASFAITTYDAGSVVTGLYFEDVGAQLYLSPPNSIRPSRNFDNGVSFDIDGTGGQWWSLDFAAPGNAPLTPGVYPVAARYTSQSQAQAGFDFSGNGHGCNTSIDRFLVREATYNGDGSVRSFAADFEQSCDNSAIEYGQVRYNSTVPFTTMLDTTWRTDASVPGKIDLNGDGKADFILRGGLNDYTAYLMDGNTATASATIIAPNSGKVILRTGDFNGDGKTDLVVENFDTSVEVWLMDGLTVTATATVMPAGRGWVVSHAGDFNGDGKTDLVWTNVLDGSVGIWLMDGTAPLQRATMLVPHSGYSPIGVGDFNHDGKSDILWRNLDGTTSIWLMDGLTIAQKGPIMNATTAWRAVKLGDFDGDGYTDILWQNTMDGSVSMWLMNGRTIRDKGNVMPAGAWSPSLIGDFNGDGRSDILWRNTDYSLGLWLMNGRTIVSRKAMGTSTWLYLPLVTADTNGDGVNEIVIDDLQNDYALGFTTWYLDGTTITGYGNVPGTAAARYKPSVFPGHDYKH
ncbi:MAG TPA: VCBS repeat-containing protein [Usitatibacter sp.]|jgi:hypothetical protein|nr:VCBS repeat-containing protein [Usitatibacter sp.]